MKFSYIYNKLKNAYEASTLGCNRFQDAIYSIAWDSMFKADGEYYFVKGDHVFTTPSLDPFDMPWNPSITPSDHSGVIEF